MIININLIFFFVCGFLIVLILYYIFKNKKNKSIFCEVILGSHPDVLVNDIINSFHYANRYGKNIRVCIFNDNISIEFDNNIKIRTNYNFLLMKFLMQSNYLYFVFFITVDGILEVIYFDFHAINYEDRNDLLLIIDHSIDKNLFDIKQRDLILNNNNTQKTIFIIKEILKNKFK